MAPNFKTITRDELRQGLHQGRIDQLVQISVPALIYMGHETVIEIYKSSDKSEIYVDNGRNDEIIVMKPEYTMNDVIEYLKCQPFLANMPLTFQFKIEYMCRGHCDHRCACKPGIMITYPLNDDECDDFDLEPIQIRNNDDAASVEFLNLLLYNVPLAQGTLVYQHE